MKDFVLKHYYELLKFFKRDKRLVAQDLPDPRDYRVKGLGRVKTPNKMDLLAKAKKKGLVLPVQSHNSCTAYAITACRKILDTIFNGVPPQYEEEVQWSYQLQTGASVDTGDYTQNALKQAAKHPQGHPFVYARFGRVRSMRDVKELIKWIAMYRTIDTMVFWRKGKWYYKPLQVVSNYALMLKLGWIVKVVGELLGGHAICICGYNKNKTLPDGTKGIAFKYYEPMQKKNKGEGYISAKDLIDGVCGNMYIISDLKDKNIIKP